MYGLASTPMTRGLEDPTNRAAGESEEKDMCYGIMYQGEGVHSVGPTDPSGPSDWEQAENRSGKPEKE